MEIVKSGLDEFQIVVGPHQEVVASTSNAVSGATLFKTYGRSGFHSSRLDDHIEGLTLLKALLGVLRSDHDDRDPCDPSLTAQVTIRIWDVDLSTSNEPYYELKLRLPAIDLDADKCNQAAIVMRQSLQILFSSMITVDIKIV
jgi:hypothetical protein